MSKEKVVLAYSGGLDTTAIIPWLKETFNLMLSAAASTADREKSLTDWMKEQSFPELLNYILKISLMSSVMTSLYLA